MENTTETGSNNSEQPAFPTEISFNEETKEATIAHGLSKREYFAGLVLQGIISGFSKECKVQGIYIPSDIYKAMALNSIELADELLKQLEQ